jgi:protein PsiE
MLTSPAKAEEPWVERLQAMDARINRLGGVAVQFFHLLALFAIGSAIVWSASVAFIGMAARGGAGINDILLLFIYLELGAMVGIYFKTNHMPVRFLIYIAITALTRLLVEDISRHHRLDMGILVVAAAILLLAVASFVIRYASARFPATNVGDNLKETDK